jgi:LPS sulfotransferase NodH
MNRFVIFTMGRTGSTAFAKELDKHPNVACHGEILRPGIFAGERAEQMPEPDKVERMSRVRPLPYRMFARLRPDDPPDLDAFARWMEHLEAHAADKRAVGFKMVDAHLRGFDNLFSVLNRLGFRVIYLTRRNVLRQVISGMVARETKVFNATDYQPQDGRKFEFVPRQVAMRMRRKIKKDAAYRQQMADLGLPFLEVTYEDFRDDKAGFYRQVCDFIGVPYFVPEASAQSIMTPEPLRQLLANYDDVARALKRNKMEHFLADA